MLENEVLLYNRGENQNFVQNWQKLFEYCFYSFQITEKQAPDFSQITIFRS